jgi:hypothetical protein
MCRTPFAIGPAHFCVCAPRGRYKNGAKVGIWALSLEGFDVSGNTVRGPHRTAITRPLVAQALFPALFSPQAQGTEGGCPAFDLEFWAGWPIFALSAKVGLFPRLATPSILGKINDIDQWRSSSARIPWRSDDARARETSATI